MARAKTGETVWEAIFGLVRVNQGPDDFLYCEFRGYMVYTFFAEQVAGFIMVPNDRLFLSEASTQSIENPDTLPYIQIVSC